MITEAQLISHFVDGLTDLCSEFGIPIHLVSEAVNGELLGRLAMQDVTILFGVERLRSMNDTLMEAAMYEASFAVGIVVDDAMLARDKSIGLRLVSAVRSAVLYLAGNCAEGSVTGIALAPDGRLIEGSGCTMWILAFDMEDIELATETSLDFVKHLFSSTLAVAGGTTVPDAPEYPELSSFEVDVFNDEDDEEPAVEVLIE